MPPFSSKTPTTRRRRVLVTAAAAAAGTAAWVKGRAQLAEQRHPPAGRFVDVDGVRLHCVERGQGAPVVLLHGNVVMLQDFIASGIFDALARRYRVIAFDRPGFGYTNRPRNQMWTPEAQATLLAKAFASLAIEKPIVVAHSWATLVAIALGLQSAAQRLVLLSGYYFPTLRVDAALVAPIAVPVVGDALRYTVAAVLSRIMLHRTIETMFAPDEPPSEYERLVPRELMLRPMQIGADAEEGTFLVPAAARLHHQYQRLTVATHIIAGAKDRICDPLAHSVRLHELLPQSTLRVLRGTGHMLHHAHVDEVVAAVDRKVLVHKTAIKEANAGSAHLYDRGDVATVSNRQRR